MKRILLDLDVLTNAFWKGQSKVLAVNFIERVKVGEFQLYTPYVFFYKLYSREIITFELDYLVTFNRKHLSSKKEQILQFLGAKNLKPIEVVLPNEI